MTHEFFVVNSNMRKITKCFWLELWLLQLHTYRDLLSVHDRRFLHNQENKVITKKNICAMNLAIEINIKINRPRKKEKKHMNNMLQKQHTKMLC